MTLNNTLHYILHIKSSHTNFEVIQYCDIILTFGLRLGIFILKSNYNKLVCITLINFVLTTIIKQVTY